MKAVFTKLVNFKASPEEHDRWKEAAHQSRMSFGKWARAQLNGGLEKTTLPATEYAVEVPKVMEERTTALAQELIERAKAVPKGKCERRLPKGTFCKSCGKIHG